MTFTQTIKDALLKKLTEEELGKLEEMANMTSHTTEEEFCQAVLGENGDLCDGIIEWADGCVSVYTFDRLMWAANNVRAVQEHEADAMACGVKSIEDAIAYCWQMAKESEMRDILDSAKAALELLPEVAA